MSTTSYNLHGVHILAFAQDGSKLRNDRDAIELIAEALQIKASVVLIPEERFEDDFFNLKTRVAGEIIQKFANYKLRLAIMGDISRHVNESSALRDFVRESNRGDHLWFVANLEDLENKLKRTNADHM